MTTTMTIADLQARFSEALEQVAAGDRVTITRNGEPVAVIVRPESLRSARTEAAFATSARLEHLLADARTKPLPPAGGLSSARADELVREIRGDRGMR
jgi:prevent-host-death family protein